MRALAPFRQIQDPTAEAGKAAPAVTVWDLVKSYPAPEGGAINAVDGVSFEVARGEIFGLLGPNGAGKTTTLEIIEGLKEPTSGLTSVLGFDSQRDRDRVTDHIGVQLQTQAYFRFLTLEEILDLFGSFYSRRVAAGELLDLVGLADKRSALVKQLSGGQARRFSVVAALVNDPTVVFLDEPTTGLDPQARRGLWELIRSINRDEGKTVILTTHYLEEAEILSDRVAVIDHGKIRALDAPARLIRSLTTASRIKFTIPHPVDVRELEQLAGVVTASGEGNPGYDLCVSRPREALSALLQWAEVRAIDLEDLQVVPASLEDVFLSLTGRTIRD